MLSSISARAPGPGVFSIGSSSRPASTTPANTMNTEGQAISPSRYSAAGGPMICPAEPAAVAMPSAIERFRSEAARPTIARITPKPVPAMPQPIRTFQSWCSPGVVE